MELTKNKTYDYVILGGGIYGLYAATQLGKHKRNKKIAILERDKDFFQRSSYINQARVHNGCHYPRSLSTAIKSAHYYERFNRDFSFAINNKFEKIYAISKQFSYTSRENFIKFCTAAKIDCTETSSHKYFNNNMIDGCFETNENGFDALAIKQFFADQISKLNIDVYFESNLTKIVRKNDTYEIILENAQTIETPFVLNATYASVNQILQHLDYEQFELKYEIAEICLCEPSPIISNTGITVMDGPFFSVMPFGLTKYHSLSAVHYTPHATSYTKLPSFACQNLVKTCSTNSLANCNFCTARPKSAWASMRQLAAKYLDNDITLQYVKSLFAIKPILQATEIDDARPTVIKVFSENPTFISVLSGKINTLYDLDEILTK
ncbi:MAG: FAD-dependent oxidoreductase [Gammaproteobacteria bacterium]|nr:FAD-dependent oxidoreductase [Gammaproteobacteria bacterium]